jgi:hypothetical protein
MVQALRRGCLTMLTGGMDMLHRDREAMGVAQESMTAVQRGMATGVLGHAHLGISKVCGDKLAYTIVAETHEGSSAEIWTVRRCMAR